MEAYRQRDPIPTARDPQRAGVPRDHIVRSLLGMLDSAERPGWWGEVSIALVIQDGRVQTLRRSTQQTEKGGPGMN